MHCKEIADSEFERISAELHSVERQVGAIETISGQHDIHGWTVLLRDASRCMVLFDDVQDQDLARAESDIEAEGMLLDASTTGSEP